MELLGSAERPPRGARRQRVRRGEPGVAVGPRPAGSTPGWLAALRWDRECPHRLTMALLADHRLLYAIEPAAAGFARAHAAPLDAARAWFATLEIPAQPRGGHALLDALRRRPAGAAAG